MKGKQWRKSVLRVVSLTLVAASLLSVRLPAAAETTVEGQYVYGGYTYDYWGNVKECSPAFRQEQTFGPDHFSKYGIQSADDVTCSSDRIFMIDKTSSRLNILDPNGNLIDSVKVVRDSKKNIAMDSASGKQIVFKSPEGVFFYRKMNEIYVADTGNDRLVVLDGSTYAFKRVITRPALMTGKTEFKPSKVAVDKDGRIYIVVQSSYEGIIELNNDGTFSRYFGVNKPKVNLIDYFWKSIASNTQKSKMQQTLAPAFNNVDVDPEGFVYATTYDANAQNMVFRLNSNGENVLRQEGNTLVKGDLVSSESEPSKMVDIAATDFGVYALLDKTRGRIFLYDFDGNLLNVFSGLGNIKGQLKQPASIAWMGNKLLVADQGLQCINVYTPTQFGEEALKASREYYQGDWDAALADFRTALKLNSNYDVAYIGIGKNYLVKQDYQDAMYYLDMGNDRTDYSVAYNKYRNIQLQKNFGFVMFLMVLGIFLLLFSEYRYYKKTKTN